MTDVTTLTTKETDLLNAVRKGMDMPGEGWLHELSWIAVKAGADWAQNEHAVAGVLGSLMAKGLVHSEEDHEGPVVCYWVRLAR